MPQCARLTHFANTIGAFPDGAWLVELASLRDPSLVPSAVATALGVRVDCEHSALAALVAHLRQRRLLLVLDNLEHLPEAASVVAELLAACPGLTVLATSQVPLRLRWEHLVPVPPLAVPRPSDSMDALTVAEAPAVALFLERARAVRPDFGLTNENAPAVARLCARLDGLPLALELAAARVNLLAPAAMLARLGKRLPLPAVGGGDRPDRHQTLRAAVAWSYDLLSPAERTAFRRLGVFAGGCSLEAAAGVIDAEGLALDALEVLASLADKSLVRASEGEGGEPRFSLLETVREHALERLAEAGELAPTRARHAAHFLALAQSAEPELTGPRQGELLGRLELEHDNLRAALDWTHEAGEVEAGLRLGVALWRFWLARGHLGEGRARLAGLIEQAHKLDWFADPHLEARGLTRAGALAAEQGDRERAAALFERGLALRRRLGDEAGVASSLNNLGYLAQHRGDLAGAAALHGEALAARRRLCDEAGVADSLQNLGALALQQRDLGRATALLEECLALRRRLGDEGGVAAALLNLGEAAHGRREHERADALLLEALALDAKHGGRRGMASCLEVLAWSAAAQGRAERAARLGGAAEVLREAAGVPIEPQNRASHEEAIGAARVLLGLERFTVAWAEGRATPLDQALELARENPTPASPPAQTAPPPPSRGPEETLSARELEVLRGVAEGLGDKKIALSLGITRSTVRYHLTSIFNKLGVGSRARVAAEATRRGLL